MDHVGHQRESSTPSKALGDVFMVTQTTEASYALCGVQKKKSSWRFYLTQCFIMGLVSSSLSLKKVHLITSRGRQTTHTGVSEDLDVVHTPRQRVHG